MSGKGFYRKRRVDGNQAAIVNCLRRVGVTVQHLHELGHGCPDLLVGHHGRCPCCGAQIPMNTLLEVKDPAQPASKRILTADEDAWHAAWRGKRPAVVETAADAFIALGVTP